MIRRAAAPRPTLFQWTSDRTELKDLIAQKQELDAIVHA